MSLRAIRSDANNVRVEWPLPSLRRFGVPPAGPFDLASFRLALAAAGMSEGSALEIGFMGGLWEAEEDCEVAIFGPPRRVRVDKAEVLVNGFSLRIGQQLDLGQADFGHRSYMVMAKKVLKAAIAALPSAAGSIRVIAPPGPFFDTEHMVTPRINRQGIRLGALSALTHNIELPSEPQCVGAIQITPDGTPIIIGPDGPTIGGYPKVGAVISADLDRLAQLRPGDKVNFEPVKLETSLELWRERNALIEGRCRQLRVAFRLQPS